MSINVPNIHPTQSKTQKLSSLPLHLSHLIHHRATLASPRLHLFHRLCFERVNHTGLLVSWIRALHMATSPSSFRSRLKCLAMVTFLLTPSFSILLAYLKDLFSIFPHWNVISMRQALFAALFLAFGTNPCGYASTDTIFVH